MSSTGFQVLLTSPLQVLKVQVILDSCFFQYVMLIPTLVENPIHTPWSFSNEPMSLNYPLYVWSALMVPFIGTSHVLPCVWFLVLHFLFLDVNSQRVETPYYLICICLFHLSPTIVPSTFLCILSLNKHLLKQIQYFKIVLQTQFLLFCLSNKKKFLAIRLLGNYSGRGFWWLY